MAPDEVRFICDHSGAKLILADAELHATLAPVAGRARNGPGDVTVVDLLAESGGDGVLDGPRYQDLLERGTDEPLGLAVDDELATISVN